MLDPRKTYGLEDLLSLTDGVNPSTGLYHYHLCRYSKNGHILQIRMALYPVNAALAFMKKYPGLIRVRFEDTLSKTMDQEKLRQAKIAAHIHTRTTPRRLRD